MKQFINEGSPPSINLVIQWERRVWNAICNAIRL